MGLVTRGCQTTSGRGRAMLGTIVFVCGAGLMGLELLAARVLAPVLGSSLYVWGAVISTVMIALSLGYWFGGQLADRVGPTRALPPVIALAGVFTIAVPAVASVVLPAVSGMGARAGSLVASAAIFFVPSLLLAMVSPLGVRLAVSGGVERLGRSAGSLYAVSTAGSIVGTLATSFWLIPLMSLEPLLVAIGLSLFGASLLALTLKPAEGELAEPQDSRIRRRDVVAITTLSVLAGAAFGAWVLAGAQSVSAPVTRGERVVMRKDTQYHRVVITEDEARRDMRFDRSRQSSMSLTDPYATDIAYPGYLHLPFAIKPDAKNVLVVGLGGGSLVKRMWRDYPDVRIDVVEIDPDVIGLAREYFSIPQDPRVRYFAEDGRRFLARTTETYDVIVMDAYYADSLPFHLTTLEFFEQAKSRLKPDGVLAYNVIASPEGDTSRLFRSMYRTCSGVWGHLWVFPIGLGDDGVTTSNRNIIVLATDRPTTRDELLANIANRVNGSVSVPGFAGFGKDLYSGRVRFDDVPILTDSHAPTDALIHVN